MDAVHVGVDILNVVRHDGRLLDGLEVSRPVELDNDGDLLAFVREMIDARGDGTVRITKVKGHADKEMVREGQVREQDRVGNDRADEAADFGRRVKLGVIDARWKFSGVCGRWYPVFLELHRFFFIAVSRAEVNNDESAGTALDPLVWSAGALLEGVGLCILCSITPCCLAHDSSGSLIGLGFFLPQFVRRMCVVGLIQWVYWLGGLHF